VAMRYALERPEAVRALALSSPFLGIKVQVPGWKSALGRLASRVYPGLSIPGEIDPALLSHDAAVGRAYAADALVPKVATARWYTEAVAAQAEVRARAPELRVPLLLLHGADDRIADPAASQAVFDRIGGSDKTLTMYPGLYHEIFNEIERGRVIQDLVTWLKAH
jgi:alpha-beta hydrolase superfamily lysophospholipase